MSGGSVDDADRQVVQESEIAGHVELDCPGSCDLIIMDRGVARDVARSILRLVDADTEQETHQ